MSKHTPGPWWIGGDKPGEHVAAFPAIKAFIDGTNVITICKVGHNNQYRGQGGRDWPNASLIAAAPMLLDALEALVAGQDAVDPDGLFRGIEGIRARAAIKAARGET